MAIAQTSDYGYTTTSSPAKSPAQMIAAQNASGQTTYVPPPTMTPGGAILQPPTASQIAAPAAAPAPAPAPAPSATPSSSLATQQAAAKPLTSSVGAPGATASPSSAANLNLMPAPNAAQLQPEPNLAAGQAAPTAAQNAANQQYGADILARAAAKNGTPSSIPPSIGPRPVATADNWQNWDALNAAWEKANEERSIAAGKADDANGYDYWETQEQLNARRGLSINPLTGAWDRADERPIVDANGRLMPGPQQVAREGGAPAPASAKPNVNLMPVPTYAQLQPNGTAQNAPGQNGVSTTPLTGQESPYAVNPTQSAGLQALLTKLQTEAGRQLDQPTVWDDPLAEQIKAQQKRGIDEDFTQQGDALDGELANRGLNWSSIAGNRLTSLATRKAQALGDVDTNIAQQRANALAAGRQSAFSNASSAAGQQFGVEQTLQNAQRGERQFTSDQNQQAWSNSLQQILAQNGIDMGNQQAWQDAINSGLNYGQGTAGTSALNNAASINNATGQQFGQQAQDNNQGLSSLIQMALKFYGGQS